MRRFWRHAGLALVLLASCVAAKGRKTGFQRVQQAAGGSGSEPTGSSECL
jgi:hypothetical protein